MMAQNKKLDGILIIPALLILFVLGYLTPCSLKVHGLFVRL